MFGELEVDVAVEQDIDFILQRAGANVFVAQIGVRDFALVERIADPADGIGVGPGNPHADARNSCGVTRNVGSGRGAGEIEAEFRGGDCRAGSKPSCEVMIQEPAGKLVSPASKFMLGDFHVELRKPVARGE